MSENDLLEFAAGVLELEGALVERPSPGMIDAVLPEGLQGALGLGELAALTAGEGEGDPRAQPCGYGSEVLSRLVERVVGAGRAAAFGVELPLASGRIPEAVQGLNLTFRVSEVRREPGWILMGFARYQAASDDERLGVVEAAVTAPNGLSLPVPRLLSLPLSPLSPSGLPEDLLSAAYPSLYSCLRRKTSADLADFREAVARRYSRDAERLKRYFTDMTWDLKRRLRRKGGEALAEKLAAVPLEHQRRLAQLEADCVLRVRMEVLGLVALCAPGWTAELEVHRRKHTCQVFVRYDGITRRWVGLRCGGCGTATLAFAMCDQGAHALCPACWESCGAGGHRPCFRCEGKPERPPTGSA